MDNIDLTKFISDCEVYKSKIDKLEKTADRHEERLQKLEIENSNTNLQFKQIMDTLKELKEKTIPELTKEIQAIKSKPAERYNTIVIAVITGIVSAIITFIVSRLTT